MMWLDSSFIELHVHKGSKHTNMFLKVSILVSLKTKLNIFNHTSVWVCFHPSAIVRSYMKMHTFRYVFSAFDKILSGCLPL